MLPEFYETVISNYDELVNRIDSIKSIFRKSKAYRVFLKHIKEALEMRQCNFFDKIEEYKEFDFLDNKVDIEMHHIVFLEVIALMCGEKLLDDIPEDKPHYVTIYQIVDEIIRVHFMDYLPVAMMSTTVHQLYHAGKYVIDKYDEKTLHKGNYKDFYKEYGKYFTDEVFDWYSTIGITKEDFKEKEK